MLKLTHLSTALAAVMIASALSGCGEGNAAPVSWPMPTRSHAQATPGAEANAAAAAKATADRVKAAGVTEAAKTEEAAAAYLRIITKFNAATAAYNKITMQRTGLPQVPAYRRAAAHTFSLAHTKEAAELRAYGAWPQSVKPWIDQFIAQKVILAELHQQMSVPAPGWDSWNSGDSQTHEGSVETSRLSSLIREALGLSQLTQAEMDKICGCDPSAGALT